VDKNEMILAAARELCYYFVNGLSFSNLIKSFVHYVPKFHESVVRMHCTVMPMHYFKCVI